MPLLHLASQYSYSFYCASDESEELVSIFQPKLTAQQTIFVNSVALPIQPYPNFAILHKALSSGFSIPFIFGNASDNVIAQAIEENSQSTIQLTGITGFHSNASHTVVQNRFGSWTIESSDGIERACLLRLRDFQVECIYICAQTAGARLLALTAFLSIWGGPFVTEFKEDDAFMIEGQMVANALQISVDCIHSTLKPDPSSLSVKKLRLLGLPT